MLPSLYSGFKLAAGTQTLLTLTSLVYGAFATQITEKKKIEHKEVFDAKHYENVTKFIGNMYSGKGVVIENGKQQQGQFLSTGVVLSRNVIFEDAAAICSTPGEVQEAFRALRRLDPECLERPKCINVEPKGESIELTYSLHQRYFKSLYVNSLLIVNIHLSQIANKREFNIFEIMKMEERWNGVQPLGMFLFTFPRRINGIISYNLTKNLIETKK